MCIYVYRHRHRERERETGYGDRGHIIGYRDILVS